MSGQNPSFVAFEDIPVSVFVQIRPSADHQIEVADANAIAIGVSHEGPQEALIPPYNTDVTPQIAARAGTSTRIYGLGETCEVIAGAVLAAGAKVKPNASGHAILAAAGENFSAIVRAGVAAIGQRLQVIIEHGQA